MHFETVLTSTVVVYICTVPHSIFTTASSSSSRKNGKFFFFTFIFTLLPQLSTLAQRKRSNVTRVNITIYSAINIVVLILKISDLELVSRAYTRIGTRDYCYFSFFFFGYLYACYIVYSSLTREDNFRKTLRNIVIRRFDSF